MAVDDFCAGASSSRLQPACVEGEECSAALSCCGDWRERGLLFIVATKGLTGNLDPIKSPIKLLRLYAYTKNAIVVVPNAPQGTASMECAFTKAEESP